MFIQVHQNPLCDLGGVAHTRNMDRRTDGRHDRVIPMYPKLCLRGGYKNTSNNSLSAINGKSTNKLSPGEITKQQLVGYKWGKNTNKLSPGEITKQQFVGYKWEKYK